MIMSKARCLHGKKRLFFNNSVGGYPSFLDRPLVVKKESELQISFDTPLSTVLQVSYLNLTPRDGHTSIGSATRSRQDHVSSRTRSPIYSSSTSGSLQKRMPSQPKTPTAPPVPAPVPRQGPIPRQAPAPTSAPPAPHRKRNKSPSPKKINLQRIR